MSAQNQRIVRVSVALSGALLLSAACHEPPALPPAESLPTATVSTRTLSTEKQQGREAVVGTVRAKLRATLEAKVAGRISKMPVDVGDRVKAGDLIAQLDVEEIGAKLGQAKAHLDQAERDMKRYGSLLSQGAATQQEYDGVRTRYEVAQAAVNEARSMLSYARVTAPFAGVITHKMADKGDLASPGRPLVDLEDPQTLRLESAVSEGLIGFLEAGMTIPVQVGEGAPIEGAVAEIAPTANPNSRTFAVKIDLPPREDLRVGQFGRALVPTRRMQILRIPEAAVVRRGQMETVFVAKDGRAVLRIIKTGKRFGEELEVVSGLEAGEAVVVSAPHDLRDGQPVEVKQ